MSILRGVLLATLFVASLVVSSGQEARAHQPGTIEAKLVSAPTSGVYLAAADPKGKGDTRFAWSFHNSDPDVDVLLVFPMCSFEGDGQKREDLYQAANLEAVLAGTATPGDKVKPDPQWSVCQASKATVPGVFLLPRGQTITLKQTLDFLPGAQERYREAAAMPLGSSRAHANDFAIPVRYYFDVIAVDPQDSPDLAAALLSGRPSQGAVSEYLRRATSGGQKDARQWLELDYLLTPDATGGGGSFRKTTYADLFLPAVLGEDPEQGTGPGNSQVVDASQYLFALDDYRTPKRVLPPQDQMAYDPNHGSVLRIDTSTDGPAGSQVCETTRADCQANPDACQCTYLAGTANCAGSGDPTGGQMPARGPASTWATYTVTGRFSAMWTDHALHPAWGWRAVAWWNDGGTWKELAEDWVQWDGSYQLVFSYTGYTGQNLRMQFRAYNRFYEPRSSTDDSVFRWRNPDRTNIATIHDEGHWYADTDGGDANGVAELYRGAYLLWSRMYWDGDIDPLRANPIKVVFPNTTYDCGLGTGNPWSCANYGGTVWLIPAHGVQPDVVQHEFAHQVHYEFWNNRFPKGSCLSHGICDNLNIGLALSEGYADFVPAWVGCSRGDANCTASYGTSMESTSVCGTTKENEWNVAQTFADLWDSHGDGDDVLWYNSEGTVHKLLFANGPSSGGACGSGGPDLGILNFKSIYDTNCSSGHGAYVDKIFDQNVK